MPRPRFIVGFIGATLTVALLAGGCSDDAPLGGSDATPSSPAISSGVGHSCAITTDGTATCWGANAWGQADAPEGQFSAIAAGNISSCAITTAGAATCWGDEGFSQLDAPEGQFSAISAGGGHSCSIRVDGTITCWGSNSRGESDTP